MALKRKPERLPYFERSYTINDVAEICKVTRQTVYKWLTVESVIPQSGWWRLPNGDKRAGQIRIKESTIKKLVEK